MNVLTEFMYTICTPSTHGSQNMYWLHWKWPLRMNVNHHMGAELQTCIFHKTTHALKC